MPIESVIDNTNLILGIIVAVLILMSAFFSLTETAFTNCSQAKIHRFAKEGNKKAIKTEELLKRSESTISTILLCNNAINILASAIATGALIKILGDTGVIYATLIMTVLVLIFGEITPKTYALKHSEKCVLFSASFMLLLVKIFSPLTNFLQHVIAKIFEFFSPTNQKYEKQIRQVSDLEEIRGTIELKHKAGSIVKYDKDMLDSILSLEETEIENIMVHRKNMASINIEQSLDKILKIALEINHSRIPLWKGNEDNIVSVLNVRKLVTIMHNNKGDSSKINLKLLTSKPWFVPSSNTLKNQLVAFKQKKEKFSMVIDEYGTLLGIITLEDILEEIVGDLEVKDENHRRLRIFKYKDSSYKIPGELAVRDINRRLNWNLPEDDDNSSTLAGFLISRTEKIPEEKEEFNFDGFSFKVLKVYQNKVSSLKVSKITNN
ncbi:MAG: Mg2+/Co2+ transporter CorB [Rickettsiales bacterium]|jgi:Mg2+/Co2+ transporter CorB